MNVPMAPASMRYSDQCRQVARVPITRSMQKASSGFAKRPTGGGIQPPSSHLRARRGILMDEERRLDEPADTGWKAWGPYLSERQWGTVREDYSPGGTA